MVTDTNQSEWVEISDRVATWSVGVGTLVVSFFALSLPIIMLALAALVLLLVPAVVIGLIASIAGIPIVLGKRVLRSRRQARQLTGPGRPTSHEPLLRFDRGHKEPHPSPDQAA
jgi:hypothetical protein